MTVDASAPVDTRVEKSPPPVSAARGRLAGLACAAIIVAATFFAYRPILKNGFISLDDQVTVYQNPKLIHLSAITLWSFWGSPEAAIYAPMTYTVFAGVACISRTRVENGRMPDFQFFPGPFHAVSLGLHIVCGLLVYGLLRRLLGRRWPALAGALLFALHPMQVESVAWVSETGQVLCGMFSLAALWLYLMSLPSSSDDLQGPPRRQRRAYFALATELYLMAMAAKPLGVIVPLLAATLHWLVLPGLPRSGRRWAIPWKLLIWLALAVPFAIVARKAQPVPQWWLKVPLWERPMVAADALCFYLAKIFYPSPLVADYDHSPRVIFRDGWVYETWILPAIIALLIVRLAWQKRMRPVVAGSMWFVAALLPVLGFTLFAYQAMSTVADRYIYLPMFGIALAGAWGLDRLLARTRRKSVRALIVIATLVLLGVLGVRTRIQTHYWHDSKILFDRNVALIGREPGTKGGP